MQWFPDPELEKFIRDIARLPEMPDEAVEYKRAMLQQQQAMEFVTGEMGLLGMKQKAELTAQGYSPEQAQLASETATPEMMQAQAYGEQEAEAVRRAHPVGQLDQQMMTEQQAMQNQPPPEDPNAEPQHQREKEKMALQEKQAQGAHSRDKEKMTLQEKIAQQKHKRDMEALKLKTKQPAKKAAPPPKKGK